jgi:hypothetical protein
MLYETTEGRRRLYRESDPCHPDREGGKITPDPAEIPPEYADLRKWYGDWSKQTTRSVVEDDPVLRAMGSGKELWADEPADEYVRRLREGWQ